MSVVDWDNDPVPRLFKFVAQRAKRMGKKQVPSIKSLIPRPRKNDFPKVLGKNRVTRKVIKPPARKKATKKKSKGPLPIGYPVEEIATSNGLGPLTQTKTYDAVSARIRELTGLFCPGYVCVDISDPERSWFSREKGKAELMAAKAYGYEGDGCVETARERDGWISQEYLVSLPLAAWLTIEEYQKHIQG